ncbi:FAD-dependent oxidoreductase [Haladaptatus sp. F3-133]|uniref:FAD-dependent oxidoreductase n=1 Tax=Halorutilus salinus TaxID=2487751 RepID=A0A9Q4C2V3_9EURY|nr:FAD-dependent oxidoreductase [Halorutilus salinus]MCX2817945.1 FAD-dependent oxidoreductase [Halorutilus salinus]
MTDEDTDILIVGGGVAGLALAGFLERDGYRPTVVERSGEGDGSGWAIGLRPNGVSVLDKLGFWTRLWRGVVCPKKSG